MPRPNPIHHEPRHAPHTLSAGGIDVVFTWSGDRWMHRVLLHGETVWESVDGPWPLGGDPRWPASPVLVELDRVGSGPAAAIVAVGLAGRSHFSASVSRVPAAPAAGEHDGLFDVLFELACRVHEPPPWLGSSYATPVSPPAPTDRLLLVPVSGCLLMPVEPGAPPSPPAGMRRLRAVVEAGTAPQPGPATVAWSYRIGRIGSSGMAGTGSA